MAHSARSPFPPNTSTTAAGSRPPSQPVDRRANNWSVPPPGRSADTSVPRDRTGCVVGARTSWSAEQPADGTAQADNAAQASHASRPAAERVAFMAIIPEQGRPALDAGREFAGNALPSFPPAGPAVPGPTAAPPRTPARAASCRYRHR